MTLSGITWDHPRGYAPLEACARLYFERTGVAVSWRRRSLQAFADQSLSVLARDYDLLVIDHPHLGEAIADGALRPLDDLIPSELMAEFETASIGPSFASYRLGGRQWALPIDAAAQVSVHRPDLLPQPPGDWADVLALAYRGGVAMPLKPVDAIDAWMTLTAHLGGPVRMDGGWIDAAIAHRALTLLRDLAERLPCACLDQDPIACLDMMSAADDHAYCPLLFGYTNYSRPGFRERPLRFADMPTLDHRPPTGSILGGAGIAISASSPQRDAAVAFAAWVAGRAVQGGCYMAHDGQPAHAAVWDDASADRLTGGFFSATRATMDGAWLRPRDNGFLAFADAGGDLVNACLRGRGDVASTLDALARVYADACRTPEPRRRCA